MNIDKRIEIAFERWIEKNSPDRKNSYIVYLKMQKSYIAGDKNGRIEFAKEVNDICKNTDIGGVCILINKKLFLGLIDTELKKMGE